MNSQCTTISNSRAIPVISTVLLSGLLSVLLAGCGLVNGGSGIPALRPATDGPGALTLIGSGSAEIPRNLPKSKRGNARFYEVFGKQYAVMETSQGYKERGRASWYGSKFHGRETSSGEVYNMYSMTAAHRSLPLPTFLTVTNIANGKSTVVKVNDRGPFHDDRIIDLSYAAAVELGVLEHGTAEVELTAVSVNLDPDTAWMHATEIKDQPVIFQVGAFSNRNRAESMRTRVDTAMQVNTAYVVPAGNDALYRVRFGVDSSIPLNQITDHLVESGIRKFTIIDD